MSFTQHTRTKASMSSCSVHQRNNLYLHTQTHMKKTPQNFISYIKSTRKFTAVLRHAALCLFYFPQNCIYFIMLSLPVQRVLTFFIKHALKFLSQPGIVKVKQN